MNDTIEKEMNLLLNHFWITKEEQKDEYFLLKRNQNKIKEFIRRNLGSKLIVHDRFIKLEKIPSFPNKNFGIHNFIDVTDYVILFLFLLYLEDKTRGEKFILSSLTDYIKNTAITLELTHVLDWNLTPHRKSMVRVINYLLELHVITLKDQDNKNFQDTKEADALYEVTGLANYIVPAFDYDIYHCKEPEDFLKQEWGEQIENKGDVRRYKVYRHLLYSPAVTKDELTESEEDYLRKMHKIIEKECKEQLGMEAEITKHLAFLFANETIQQKDYFPNNKKISDLILILNRRILEYQKKQQIPIDERECFYLTKEEFEQLLEITRKEEAAYFSKYYLDLSISKYMEEIQSMMSEFHFIKEEQNRILCYPLITRFIGKTELKSITKNEQLELEVS